jgi:hypothetical protein
MLCTEIMYVVVNVVYGVMLSVIVNVVYKNIIPHASLYTPATLHRHYPLITTHVTKE